MQERRAAGGSASPGVAFVLGGGGHLGAHQVGMLRALVEHGIHPGLIVGTSVGAINGALVASDPSVAMVEQLVEVWNGLEENGILSGSMLRQVGTLVRTRTHLHSNGPLRRLFARALPDQQIEDLRVPFQCVAASIERAAEHWFTAGPVVEAVLASAALPGVLPAMAIDGEHFLDGGIVNSIPVGRAVALGAHTVYVLQVGRIESSLTPPRWPWEVGLVAFEIARRHRFVGDMAAVPAHVTVHVLPTGVTRPPHYNDWSQFRYRDFSKVRRRIDSAYEATGDYLAGVGSSSARAAPPPRPPRAPRRQPG